MSYIVILCTTGSEENARLIARTLVEEKLAACVNINPQITSVYSWKDEIVEDNEFLLIIKTKAKLFEKAGKRISELHSYELPEIISLDITQGSKEYLNWIDKETIF